MKILSVPGVQKKNLFGKQEIFVLPVNSSLMPCQKYVTGMKIPLTFQTAILAIHTKCPTSQNSDDSFMPPWNAVSSKSKNLCLAKLFNGNKLLSSLWKRSYIIRKQRARGLNFWSRFQAVPQICMMADNAGFLYVTTKHANEYSGSCLLFCYTTGNIKREIILLQIFLQC